MLTGGTRQSREPTTSREETVVNDSVKLQLAVVSRTFSANTEGVSHQESLLQPREAGNCINWVAGHLVLAYDRFLGALGSTPALDGAEGAPYGRGSEPLTDPAQAKDFGELRAAFETAHGRMMELVEQLDEERLAEPAPYSPGSSPEETVGSLLTLLAFHQAYHVGQLGLLRRLAGKEGAIR